MLIVEPPAFSFKTSNLNTITTLVFKLIRREKKGSFIILNNYWVFFPQCGKVLLLIMFTKCK